MSVTISSPPSRRTVSTWRESLARSTRGPRRRGSAERGPQPIDWRVYAAFEIDEGVSRPEPAAQLLASDDASGLFHQGAQNRERLRLQPDPDALFAQLSGFQVQLERTKSDTLRCSR